MFLFDGNEAETPISLRDVLLFSIFDSTFSLSCEEKSRKKRNLSNL